MSYLEEDTLQQLLNNEQSSLLRYYVDDIAIYNNQLINYKNIDDFISRNNRNIVFIRQTGGATTPSYYKEQSIQLLIIGEQGQAEVIIDEIIEILINYSKLKKEFKHKAHFDGEDMHLFINSYLSYRLIGQPNLLNIVFSEGKRYEEWSLNFDVRYQRRKEKVNWKEYIKENLTAENKQEVIDSIDYDLQNIKDPEKRESFRTWVYHNLDL